MINQFTIFRKIINNQLSQFFSFPLNATANYKVRKNSRCSQIVLLLLISLIGVVQSTACNSFPKIFGGSSGSNLIYQIDVFNDYLALAGDIQDSSLAGTSITFNPQLVLTSISTGGKYYWAKALSLKNSSTFFGVQFSTDGALLIAHSGWSLDIYYIVVFNVTNGNVLSSRRYSEGGYWNYKNPIRSMALSSGSSPMAYVLSNYQPTDSWTSCTKQNLIKFDPLTFSAPVWVKQTNGTTNCGHLGLVFGRNQSFLYSFSRYNGNNTVSFLDTNGESYWQYSTPNGSIDYSNMIKYKEINSSTDLVIASSGSTYINYYLIISSSILPFQVSVSKSFRDPTLKAGRKLKGLYIVSENNSVSLIYDDLNTEVATIDFLSAQISFQKAFPPIIILQSAIFTSPTVFYAGYYNRTFYTDTSTSNSKSH